MTFSIFQWRCSNAHGESLFADGSLIALEIWFIAMSLLRNLKLGGVASKSDIPSAAYF
jgi:hypothetical protein